MEILKILGCWPRIWAMLKSWLQLLSVGSRCLGSHPPEGGVVLGSDTFGCLFLCICYNISIFVTYVCAMLLYYFMLHYHMLVIWLIMYCGMACMCGSQCLHTATLMKHHSCTLYCDENRVLP